MEILKLPQVERMTSLSKPTIYRLIRKNRFPRQLLLSDQCVGWRRDEILDWLRSRPRAGVTT